MIKTPLSTVIGGAFWTPGATVINGAKLSFEIVMKKLFANGEQGFWYDPNDLSTMFQDAAGTIPVAAVGQPVGLVLDKSKGVPASRRNLLTYSEDFSSASWLKALLLVTKDVKGYKATNSANGGYIHQGSSTTNAAVRTTTFILGTASARYVHLKVAALALGANQAGVVVDMVNKTITATTTGGAGYTVLSSSLQVLENGNIKVVLTTQGYVQAQRVVINSATTSDGTGAGITGDSFYLISVQFEEGDKATAYQKIDSDYGSWTAGNHAYQTTSAARPILQDALRRIDFDAVDDKLITNLPAQLTGCTVIRSVLNVGTQILTGQTIPATYEDNKDHCGLIVINRALTPSETSAIAAEFNKRAGV